MAPAIFFFAVVMMHGPVHTKAHAQQNKVYLSAAVYLVAACILVVYIHKVVGIILCFYRNVVAEAVAGENVGHGARCAVAPPFVDAGFIIPFFKKLFLKVNSYV